MKSEQWSMPFWVRSALPLATEGTQECIWNLSYNDRRMAIELELTTYLQEEEVGKLFLNNDERLYYLPLD